MTSTNTVTVTGTATITASSTASATGTPIGELVTTTNVNCQIGPSTANQSLGVVSKGTVLRIRGATTEGWTPVICFGQAGWISAQYGATMTPTATPSRTATVKPTVGSGSAVTTARVNCRTAPSTSGSIIVVLNTGTVVPLRGAAQSGWTPVVCGGTNGWISSQYLRTGYIGAIRLDSRVGTVTPLPDGRCVLEAGADSLWTIAVWCAAFDRNFVVRDPPERVTHMRVLADRYARATG